MVKIGKLPTGPLTPHPSARYTPGIFNRSDPAMWQLLEMKDPRPHLTTVAKARAFEDALMNQCRCVICAQLPRLHTHHHESVYPKNDWVPPPLPRKLSSDDIDRRRTRDVLERFLLPRATDIPDGGRTVLK